MPPATYTLSEDRAQRMHTVLYKACGLEVPPMTGAHLSRWRFVMSVLGALENTSGGPLRPKDLMAVVATMQAANRKGGVWAIRPDAILKDPERLLDMVLESRRKLRIRPTSQLVERRTGDGARIQVEHDAAAAAVPQQVGELTKEYIEDLKRKAGLIP